MLLLLLKNNKLIKIKYNNQKNINKNKKQAKKI